MLCNQAVFCLLLQVRDLVDNFCEIGINWWKFVDKKWWNWWTKIVKFLLLEVSMLCKQAVICLLLQVRANSTGLLEC